MLGPHGLEVLAPLKAASRLRELPPSKHNMLSACRFGCLNMIAMIAYVVQLVLGRSEAGAGMCATLSALSRR